MNRTPLPDDVRQRVMIDFPGEAELAMDALSGLAHTAEQGGHDVPAVLSGVLDYAQGDLVRLNDALEDAHRRYRT